MTTYYRKRLKRFEIRNQPRFLTFSCFRRLPLFADDPTKDAFVERLALARKRSGFRLVAWVVMPDHIHMIIIPNLPASDMGRTLNSIKRRFAERMIRSWKQEESPWLGRVEHRPGRFRFWQAGGGYDRNVRDEAELREKIDYIQWNPVRRELVVEPIDWRWSSARWYAGMREGEMPMDLLPI